MLERSCVITPNTSESRCDSSAIGDTSVSVPGAKPSSSDTSAVSSEVAGARLDSISSGSSVDLGGGLGIAEPDTVVSRYSPDSMGSSVASGELLL